VCERERERLRERERERERDGMWVNNENRFDGKYLPRHAS
jgi:hypothetical protein